MFQKKPKGTGKTLAKPHAIPGAKKKSLKSTAAHKRGFVAPQAGVKSPEQLSQDSIDQDADDLTGEDSAESGVEAGGDDDGHEDEGGPCIENCESIADAIGQMKANRKTPRKYDSGTNTYR